jgi:hypothetical protein
MKKKKNKTKDEMLKELAKIEADYEAKRIEALKDISQEINYGKIFFQSPEVEKNRDEYLDMYEKIRQNKMPWKFDSFNKLFKVGKNLQNSILSQLKIEFEKDKDLKKLLVREKV